MNPQPNIIKSYISQKPRIITLKNQQAMLDAGWTYQRIDDK
jgi:hypothetical protein